MNHVLLSLRMKYAVLKNPDDLVFVVSNNIVYVIIPRSNLSIFDMRVINYGSKWVHKTTQRSKENSQIVRKVSNKSYNNVWTILGASHRGSAFPERDRTV